MKIEIVSRFQEYKYGNDGEYGILKSGNWLFLIGFRLKYGFELYICKNIFL